MLNQCITFVKIHCITCITLMTSADFFKIVFFKKIFQKHYQSVKQFGSRSGPHSVGTGLNPNCLQMLLADEKNRRSKQGNRSLLYNNLNYYHKHG